MFSHIYTSVGDFASAYRFYDQLLRILEVEPRFHDPSKPWAGWQSSDGRPLFVIGWPQNGEPHHPGNGQMVAFTAKNRAMVRHAHEVAIKSGGRCEGAPGLRPQYHAHYYGAYFRDLDGNKICVVCRSDEG